MGNKSGKYEQDTRINDTSNEREKLATWHRTDIAVTDVYRIVGSLGQGHMGEVFKVQRKVEMRGLHNFDTRNRTSRNMEREEDAIDRQTRSVSPFRNKKSRKQKDDMRRKLFELNRENEEARVKKNPPDVSSIVKPKPILRRPSRGIIRDTSNASAPAQMDFDEEAKMLHASISSTVSLPITSELLDSNASLSSSNEVEVHLDGDEFSVNTDVNADKQSTPRKRASGNLLIPRNQVRFQRHYACKTVITSHVKKGHLDELINEIYVMRTLDHPYIIRLYEVYQVKRKIWLVTELCTGGNLTSRKHTEAQVTLVTEQILQGVTYLHRRGFCHRDLKLENILYEHGGADATIRLIDFGLSQTYDRGIEKRRKFTGAAYTLSPEVASGSGPYTEKSDIWSIGVVVWVMLAGDFPFLRDHEELKDKAKRDELIQAKYSFGITWRGRGISKIAKDFVARCLSRKPEDRWTAREALEYVQNTWIPALEDTVSKAVAKTEKSSSTESGKSGGDTWISSKNPDIKKKGDLSQILNQTTASKRRSQSEGFHSLGDSVVEDIERFVKYGLLKKTILVTMANTMDRRDAGRLREIFLTQDTENTGTISLFELREALKQINSTELEEETVQAIFKGIDLDKSGQIHYAEFLAALVESQGLITMDRLADAFDRLDTEGKGYISHNDLKAILGNNYDKAVVDKMIEEADFKKNGQVDYDELLQLMFEDPEAGLEATGDLTDALKSFDELDLEGK